MSTQNRPQYKPTAQLQNILDILTPDLAQSLGNQVKSFQLLSYSGYSDNPDKFTFYVEGSGKRYKLELEQITQGDKTVMRILQAFEIITK